MPVSSTSDSEIAPPFILDSALVVLSRGESATSRAQMAKAAGLALGVSPDLLNIGTLCAHCGSTAHGQPFAHGSGSCGVSFSRAGEYAIAAAHRGDRVGIDIESVVAVGAHRVDDVLLSAAEHESAQNLGPRERSRFLARLWVAKEAVTKLAGLGLRVDLTELDVRFDGATGELAAWPQGLGLAASPRVTLFDVSDDIVGAIALPT